eukprot:225908-Amphidinium_carterae.2
MYEPPNGEELTVSSQRYQARPVIPPTNFRLPPQIFLTDTAEREHFSAATKLAGRPCHGPERTVCGQDFYSYNTRHMKSQQTLALSVPSPGCLAIACRHPCPALEADPCSSSSKCRPEVE